jgi:hypothetical protein
MVVSRGIWKVGGRVGWCGYFVVVIRGSLMLCECGYCVVFSRGN